MLVVVKVEGRVLPSFHFRFRLWTMGLAAFHIISRTLNGLFWSFVTVVSFPFFAGLGAGGSFAYDRTRSFSPHDQTNSLDMLLFQV